MKGGFLRASGLGLAVVITAFSGMAQAQEEGIGSILDGPQMRQLEGQDVDANKELLEILRLRAKKGPLFRISPEEVRMNLKVGQVVKEVVRITNIGDEVGEVKGVNSVGSIEGLNVETNCETPIRDGDFCEIFISYEAESKESVKTAIIGVINEHNRQTFEIPVSIRANEQVRAAEPEPTPPPVVRPAAPVGPTSHDIAAAYFNTLSRAYPVERSPRGFTIVSLPSEKDPQDESFAGVSYRDVDVETIVEDPRYDPIIASTTASLPVDRSKIITTDRVIKAVLETPVSNIMCNKTVAVVESDVYSATSLRPLIPAGSRVIGECREFVDERTGIAWNRIITTDGRSITFDEKVADTADATGRGGALGRIYMSPFDKYVLPIFSTMIDTAAGVIYATFGEDEEVIIDENGNVIQETSAKNEGIRIVTEEARGTAKEIIKDIQDVREIAVVPAGSRIDIEINEDIYFADSRKVVRLADLTFGLAKMDEGEASRDIPEDIRLVPVDEDYAGAAIMIDGRRYKIEGMTSDEPLKEATGTPAPLRSLEVLEDLSAR